MSNPDDALLPLPSVGVGIGSIPSGSINLPISTDSTDQSTPNQINRPNHTPIVSQQSNLSLSSLLSSHHDFPLNSMKVDPVEEKKISSATIGATNIDSTEGPKTEEVSFKNGGTTRESTSDEPFTKLSDGVEGEQSVDHQITNHPANTQPSQPNQQQQHQQQQMQSLRTISDIVSRDHRWTSDVISR